MRLLLAEDDQAVGRAICIYMMRDGHAVDWVTDGNEMLSLMRKFVFDCVMLDLGLPALDGCECLRNLRANSDATPVVVITAQAHRDQRIELLDLGADDYLVKPIDLDELKARVQAVIRRSGSSEEVVSGDQTYGGLTLLSGSNQVQWEGRRIELTTTEFKILALLARRHNQTVTRAQLEAEIYGAGAAAGGNSIEVHVHHLRRKLGPGLILTLRGIGYQIKTS